MITNCANNIVRLLDFFHRLVYAGSSAPHNHYKKYYTPAATQLNEILIPKAVSECTTNLLTSVSAHSTFHPFPSVVSCASHSLI